MFPSTADEVRVDDVNGTDSKNMIAYHRKTVFKVLLFRDSIINNTFFPMGAKNTL